MQSQRGFIGVGVLIAILVGLAVLGGGAYYVVNQQSAPDVASDSFDYTQVAPTNIQAQAKKNDQQSGTQTATSNGGAKTSSDTVSQMSDSYKTYRNGKYGFSIQIPKDWSIKYDGDMTLAPGDALVTFNVPGITVPSDVSVSAVNFKERVAVTGQSTSDAEMMRAKSEANVRLGYAVEKVILDSGLTAEIAFGTLPMDKDRGEQGRRIWQVTLIKNGFMAEFSVIANATYIQNNREQLMRSARSLTL